MAGAALAVAMAGGTVALVGGMAWATQRARKARTEAMRVVATTMGFHFAERVSPEALGAFPLMEHGRGREGRNVLTGQLAGRSATICDYRYVVQSGKSSHAVIQTVAIFTDAQGGLPDFELRPENIFHKLGAVFGYQDIDFETNEEFSAQYLLRGQDEAAIRRAFNSSLLMLLSSEPGWCLQATAGRLMVFRSAKVADAAQVPSFAADALRLAGVFGKS
jgi:hypothetical protein